MIEAPEVAGPLLSLDIPGSPVAKARHRVRAPTATQLIRWVRSGASPRTMPRPQLYQPVTGPTAQWERLAAMLMRSKFRQAPISGPVAVHTVSVMPRPQRIPKRQPGRTWAPKKPDLDNIVKSILDAVVMARVIEDDRLVVQITAEQVYAAIGEAAHTELTISGVQPL